MLDVHDPALGNIPSSRTSRTPSAVPGCLARGRTALLVALLLAIHAALALEAAWRKGVSFDEAQQLAVGYNLWLNHDYRIEGGNGDLVKRWATLPYLFSQPAFVPRDHAAWRDAEPYVLAHDFFFGVGNSPESLLRQGRVMMVLLGLATGLLVFHCGRVLTGPSGGLVALALFALSPNMLAFGSIVSTDLPITLTMLAATWGIWRLLHGLTPGRLGFSLVSCGLLVLAKPSALVILPIAAVLVTVRLIAGGAWELRVGNWRRALRRRGQAALFALLAVLHVLAGWTAIWAHYEFRYAASPEPANPALRMRSSPAPHEEPAVVRAIFDWSRRTHFFPEGFRRGMRWLVGTTDDLRSFMNGAWRLGGSPAFFPFAIWAKTPPAILLLLALAAGRWFWLRRPTGTGTPAGPATSLRAYELTPFLALTFVYLGIAMAEDVNLGFRHVLPITPALYVLAGTVVAGWKRPLTGGLVVGGLLGWLAIDSLAIRPNYLAYFGRQVGGPENGYKHLLDSSLDWGMNLPDLKAWLDRHNTAGEKVFLAYFGTDRPEHYGIRAQRLPGFFDWRPPGAYAVEPGLYAISASLFQGLHTQAFGPWNREFEEAYQSTFAHMRAFEQAQQDPAGLAELLHERSLADWEREFAYYDQLRFARLCAWLRQKGPPPVQVAYSIFVWRLDLDDLEAALLGPPAELEAWPIEPLIPDLARR